MIVDKSSQLVEPLKVVDIDGNVVGSTLTAAKALELLQSIWFMTSPNYRQPTRVELGEWNSEICWCDVRLNYGSVLPFLKLMQK